MKEEYKVRFMMDSTYEVVLIHRDSDDDEYPEEEKVHQGSLADCEVYIRLKLGGYM